MAGEFDEFDLSRFRVGNTYELPSRLASLLIIAGYAELLASESDRAEAADYDSGYFRKRRPKRQSRD